MYIVNKTEESIKDYENGFVKFDIDFNGTKYKVIGEKNHKWSYPKFTTEAQYQFEDGVWDWEYDNIQNPLSPIQIEEMIEKEFNETFEEWENEQLSYCDPYTFFGVSKSEFL